MGFIGCIKLVLLHSRIFFFLVVLYRPEEVLNLVVLVSIGLLLCVPLTLVLVAKACQRKWWVYSPFSQVYMTTECVFHDETVLVYLMWQYGPISFLYIYPVVTQFCVFHLLREDTYFSGTIYIPDIKHTLQHLSLSTLLKHAN